MAWNGKISNAIWKPEDYKELDDTLLKRIEWDSSASYGGGLRMYNPKSTPALTLNEWRA